MQTKRIGKFISIAYRFAMVFFKNRMAELGLHQSHHSVLLTLYKHEGVSQEKLSKILSVDKATITRSIKKLVEDGFVKRVQDEHDKRSYLLYTTEKAAEVKPQLEDMFKEWNAVLLDGFTPEEADQAIAILERISSNVLKHHDAADLRLTCTKNEVNNDETK